MYTIQHTTHSIAQGSPKKVMASYNTKRQATAALRTWKTEMENCGGRVMNETTDSITMAVFDTCITLTAERE